MGLNWRYENAQDVFNEIRLATPSMAGITWERFMVKCKYLSPIWIGG